MKIFKYFIPLLITIGIFNSHVQASFNPIVKEVLPTKNVLILYGKQLQFKDISGNITTTIYTDGLYTYVSGNIIIDADNITTGTLPNARLDSGQDVSKHGLGNVNNTTQDYIKNLSADAQTQINSRVDLTSSQNITGRKVFGTGTNQLDTGGDTITINYTYLLTESPSEPANIRDGMFWRTSMNVYIYLDALSGSKAIQFQ